VSKFDFSREALRDLDKIRRRYHQVASVRVADMVETAIFDAVLDCARLPIIGHRRSDVHDKSILFHTVYEYEIIFRRQPDVFVLRVIHGRRDLPKRLGSG
jgi:plasmid stabilization system protein ParE